MEVNVGTRLGKLHGDPGQAGLSQTGGPEHDVGRPEDVRGVEVSGLRSVRDSLVSEKKGGKKALFCLKIRKTSNKLQSVNQKKQKKR